MRIGNSVGLPAFQNTNRKNPKYSKSKRKQVKAIQALLETAAYNRALNSLSDDDHVILDQTAAE